MRWIYILLIVFFLYGFTLYTDEIQSYDDFSLEIRLLTQSSVIVRIYPLMQDFHLFLGDSAEFSFNGKEYILRPERLTNRFATFYLSEIYAEEYIEEYAEVHEWDYTKGDEYHGDDSNSESFIENFEEIHDGGYEEYQEFVVESSENSFFLFIFWISSTIGFLLVVLVFYVIFIRNKKPSLLKFNKETVGDSTYDMDKKIPILSVTDKDEYEELRSKLKKKF